MPALIGGFFPVRFHVLHLHVHGSCSATSSRPSFKTQSRDYTHRTPMPLSEYKLASGNTTNSDYTYCGFVSSTTNATSDSTGWVNSSSTPNPSIGPGRGTCTGSKFAMAFTPYDYMTSDMLSNYTILSNNFIPDTPFRDSKTSASLGQAAYWMLLLGTISIFFAIVTYVPQYFSCCLQELKLLLPQGIKKTHFTFFLSSGFSLLSAVLLLIAVSIYTVSLENAKL
jgi:hypothetical protein